MSLGSLLSRASLLVALAAFGVTGALSLRARVEPLYLVLRSIAAFLGVLWLARCGAGVLDSLGPGEEARPEGEPGAPGEPRPRRGKDRRARQGGGEPKLGSRPERAARRGGRSG